MTKIPPLPEPALLKDSGWKMDVAGVEVEMMEWEPGAKRVPRRSFFTADQMNAHALATWNAALEAAAKMCDDYESQRWDAYKRGHGPERASDYCQGQSDGAGDCANAIRSMKEPQ